MLELGSQSCERFIKFDELLTYFLILVTQTGRELKRRLLFRGFVCFPEITSIARTLFDPINGLLVLDAWCEARRIVWTQTLPLNSPSLENVFSNRSCLLLNFILAQKRLLER